MCVRLDGRESAENAALKRAYGPVVLGNVQNRIVSPTGENLAALPIHFDTERLARYLREWASVYPGVDEPAAAHRPLPYFASVRQALNVAACDARLLVLIVGGDPQEQSRLEARARALAWSPELSGRFHFVAARADDPVLEEIAGISALSGPALCLVRPDIFGMSGHLLWWSSGDADDQEVAAAGRDALRAHAEAFENRTLVDKFRLHAERGEREWSYG